MKLKRFIELLVQFDKISSPDAEVYFVGEDGQSVPIDSITYTISDGKPSKKGVTIS